MAESIVQQPVQEASDNIQSYLDNHDEAKFVMKIHEAEETEE